MELVWPGVPVVATVPPMMQTAGLPFVVRSRLLIAMPLACIACGGCAQSAAWKMPAMPWQHDSKTDRDSEKYGQTADERMKTLTERAKAARSQGGEAEAVFTAELATMMLTEHDPRVRAEIISVAAGFSTPSAMAICRGGMEDPDDRVRMAACDVWGERGGDEAVSLLSHRYQTDTEIDVRLRAIRRLGAVKDKAAIRVLAKALEDPDPAVQYRAVASLKQVSGRDLGDDVNRWRAWAADPESEPNWSVAETLRKIF